jgi:hypothetical protein
MSGARFSVIGNFNKITETVSEENTDHLSNFSANFKDGKGSKPRSKHSYEGISQF